MVTFPAGSRFTSYANIPIANDRVPEDDEHFKAKFEIPVGYTNLNKGDPKEAVITIEDVTGYRHIGCVSVYVYMCIQKYPCHRQVHLKSCLIH